MTTSQIELLYDTKHETTLVSHLGSLRLSNSVYAQAAQAILTEAYRDRDRRTDHRFFRIGSAKVKAYPERHAVTQPRFDVSVDYDAQAFDWYSINLPATSHKGWIHTRGEYHTDVHITNLPLTLPNDLPGGWMFNWKPGRTESYYDEWARRKNLHQKYDQVGVT